MVYVTLTKDGAFFSTLLVSPAECNFWIGFAQRNRFAIMLIDAPLE